MTREYHISKIKMGPLSGKCYIKERVTGEFGHDWIAWLGVYDDRDDALLGIARGEAQREQILGIKILP